jgi:hypothetical protein
MHYITTRTFRVSPYYLTPSLEIIERTTDVIHDLQIRTDTLYWICMDISNQHPMSKHLPK